MESWNEKLLPSDNVKVATGRLDHGNRENKLLTAVKADDIRVVKDCLDHGAVVNCTESKRGNTPLHLAAQDGRAATASLLIRHGAIVDVKNYDGNTPLHLAAREDRKETAELLISHGAQVDIREIDGQTPLHLAVLNGQTETSGLLIRYGANLHVQDKWGNTLYDAASKDEMKELLKTAKDIIKVGIPRELIHLGKEAVSIFTDLLKEESYDLFELRSMLHGEQGTGKSTIARFLAGKAPKKFRMSTDGIDLYTGVSFFDDDTEEWISGKQDFTLEDITVSQSVKTFHQPRDRSEPGEKIFHKQESVILASKGTNKDALNAKGLGHLSQREDDLTISGTTQPMLPIEAHGKIFEEQLLSSQKCTDASFLSGEINESDKMQRMLPEEKKKERLGQDHSNDEKLTSYKDQRDDAKTKNKPEDVKALEIIKNPGIIGKLKALFGVKNEVKEVKISVTKTTLFRKSKDIVNKNFHKRKLVPVIIWDFGGQDVFYSTHQTFLTYRAVYMLVLDGSRTLNEPCKYEPFLPGRAGCKTQKDYVRFWINTIITYCKGDVPGFPKIMVILTHKDKLDVKEIEARRIEIFREIEVMFAGSPAEQHLIIKDRLFVNARNSEDPEMKQIKKSLIQQARNQPTWGQKLPKCFLPLELEIQYLAKEGLPLIHIEHLKNINLQQPIRPLTESEIKIFLKFQHSVGKILYFDEPYLEKNIIILPTYLIDAFRSIITDHQFCRGHKTKEKAWYLMDKKGIILKETVKIIWKQKKYAHFLKSMDYLLGVMLHLDVLVEPLRYDSTHNRTSSAFYYVASMIRTQDTTGYLRSKTFSERNIALCFDTFGRIIPPAISFRFISYCLSIWGVKTYGDENEDMLFHMSAVFTIDQSLDMHIQCEEDHLIVRLVHAKNRTLIMKDMASSIRQCLVVALQKITQHYIESSCAYSENKQTFDVKACCSWSAQPCSIAFKDISDVWICPQHQIKHRRDLIFAWFTEEESEECKSVCPVTNEEFLQQSPSELHLQRLALKYDFNEVRQLVIQLKLPFEIWNELTHSKLKEETIRFTALYECIKRMPFTFNDIKNAAAMHGIKTPHTLCQVLREKNINFDSVPEKWYSSPTDEEIDKLAPFVGQKSLAFLIELGLTFQDWEQIEYSHNLEPNLVKLNRQIMETWRAKCKDIKPTLRKIGQAFTNIGTNIKIIEDLLFP